LPCNAETVDRADGIIDARENKDFSRIGRTPQNEDLVESGLTADFGIAVVNRFPSVKISDFMTGKDVFHEFTLLFPVSRGRTLQSTASGRSSGLWARWVAA
jgi:hypothetical protein